MHPAYYNKLYTFQMHLNAQPNEINYWKNDHVMKSRSWRQKTCDKEKLNRLVFCLVLSKN